MEVGTQNKKYCNSLTKYSRYKTRVVMVGDVGIGGDNPIRVQSMTTTDTMDTKGTVEQSIRMIEAGSELVRITAPALKEAKNLENIKNELRARGYNTPIVADIHFKPDAAELAARIVEKVRVNPGNYADKKRFKVFSFTDEMYNEELERIYEEFAPLVKVCKDYGTAMRIGTNHGSLSDRIMNRFGDTPLGMVESALEFVRICRDLNYHELILSMKASNTQVMVQAYRLLVSKMEEEGMNYPLHLGVTEAGDGEDGRIKSAVGIGTLLEDGLGDTIRVSLTEDPEFEIPVCKRIVAKYNDVSGHKQIADIGLRISEYNNNPVVTVQSEIENPQSEIPYDPFSYQRRKTYQTDKIGNHHVPVVILSPEVKAIQKPEGLSGISYGYDTKLDKWNIGDMAADFIYLGKNTILYKLPGTLKIIHDYAYWKDLVEKSESFPLFSPEEYLNAERKSFRINFLSLTIDDITSELLEAIRADKFCVLILNANDKHAAAEQRRLVIELMELGLETPVIIKRKYNKLDDEDLTLYSATEVGSLLIDGMGDGIWIESPETNLEIVNRISFGVLQATRTRISKTEYISCPSCGRTQFDLQVTTAMIKKRTDHLKGVKIAIMGCIVNGPGEMADADYGFVGSGPNWVSLYRGKDVIERGIPYAEALERLIELMKEDGIWVGNVA